MVIEQGNKQKVNTLRVVIKTRYETEQFEKIKHLMVLLGVALWQ